MEPTKVVVRYANGTLARGFIQNFSPNKDFFYLTPADNSSGPPVYVSLKRLKAVFVVRDFHGNPKFEERNFYMDGENPSGLKLEVTFADGEVMVGSTLLSYDAKRQGNFIIPADPKSNNIRVFVVSSAVKRVRQLFDDVMS
jgi:hypothetical protein